MKIPKQINLKVLLDVLELKHYETSFMQCDCESEINFFVTVPKEDVILIPGLKEFQDFFTKLITNLYKKKKINNHFELNDYLNFNLNLLFNYSPFAIKDDDESLWNIHKNYIEVEFNYNDPENNELDCEFDRLIDSISEEYKKEIT